MVERGRHPTVATVFVPEPLAAGAELVLAEDVAQHLRTRRVHPGSRIGIVNGSGGAGAGTLTRLGRADAGVTLDDAWTVAPPAAVHLIVPVADRDRMLWLAEKSAELGATSWRPAFWQRSRSVTPRGEGPKFQTRVLGRMALALEQSGGAWLPEVHSEASVAEVIAGLPDAGTRLLLDPSGEPILAVPLRGPVTVAVGPEGGVEPDEHALLVRAGFRPVALADTILRFETAAIAALAITRSRLEMGP